MTEPHSAGVAVVAASDTVVARRRIWLGLAITVLLASFGLLARSQMIRWGLVFPGPVNVFFRLYALHEPVPLLLLIAWTAAAAIAMATRRSAVSIDTRLERLHAPSARAVAVLAVLMFVVALVTWYRVHHAVLLTMDEFTSDFQARILAHGELRASVPAEWRPYLDAMAPVFTAYRDLGGGWLSQYLPGYALLKTPFVLTGHEVLLNPLLAALSVVLLAAIARRLWPDEGLRPWMALLFFVTS